MAFPDPLETRPSRPEPLSNRVSCTEIKNHPFYTKVIFGALDMQPDHPLFRLVQFLTQYEAEGLFSKYDQITKGMRRALGWTQSGQSALSPEDAKKLRAIDSSAPIQKDAWDRLCSLFTAYRLIDAFTAGNVTGQPHSMQQVQQFAVNKPWQRYLDEATVKNIRGYEKLTKWPNVLRQARIAIEHMQSLSQDTLNATFTPSENPHLSHLAALSKRDVQHRHGYILDNFQAAAMHLSYIIKMPRKEADGTLPDIPERLDDLLIMKVSADVLSADTLNDSETKSFLAGTSALQLRLPLQYALSISPLCLFFTVPLHKTACDRCALFKTSRGLGNLRPSELRRIEEDILTSLFHISSKPMDLKLELQRLVSSENWRVLENLPASNPAFHFFDLKVLPQALGGSVEDPREAQSNHEKDSCSQTGIDPPTSNTGERRTNETNRFNDDKLNEDVTAATRAGQQASGKTSTVVVIGSDKEAGVDQLIGQREPAAHADGAGEMDGPNMLAKDTESHYNQPPPTPCQGLPEGKDLTVGVDAQVGDGEDIDGEDKGGNVGDNDVMIEDSATTPLRQSVRLQTKIQNDIDNNITMVDLANSKSVKKPKRKAPTANLVTESLNSNTDATEADKWKPKPVTLNVDHKPLKMSGRVIDAHGPTGQVLQFDFQAHDHHTLYMIQRLWANVESAYENEKPLHISNPANSGFFVMNREQAARKTSEDWLSILKTQNVVVTGDDFQEEAFKRALQDLGAPKTVMTIQDQSIPAHDDYNERRFQGTFSQVLKASQSPEGKILNVLDIPLPACGLKETPYASNVSALMATRGAWGATQSMPMGEVNWALAATAGAFHTWHIDCNGFMTFVSPVCGAKLWIIARPHMNANFEDFANVDLFLDKFDLDQANETLWTLEAVLLRPGDTLIMRPNTPHAVYTPTATVVHGGHCYSSSTLQESLVGMVHAFIANAFITNTNHLSSRFHLQQMIAFFHMALVQGALDEDDRRMVHVPDCRIAANFINLMAICMFGILINVLDFATYQYPGKVDEKPTKPQREEMILFDINAMSEEERYGCTYTRGQALEIMQFVASKFKFEHQNDLSKWKTIQSYQEEMILGQCQMIYNYKIKAQLEKVSGATGCNLELLKVQLSGVLDGKMNDKIKRSLKTTTISAMQLPALCSGLRVNDSPLPESLKKSDPMVVGISVRDRLYRDRERIKSERQEDHHMASSPTRKRKKV